MDQITCLKKIVDFRRLLLVFLTFASLIFYSVELCATHNRAGEITYEQIDDLTIRATIVTYTRTSSFAADRDSLTLYWGDGDSTVVLRSNGNGFELPNDIKRNEYIGEHTYPTRGSYTMTVVDPNRIAGILNIDFPNSVNIKFYIETTLTLLEPRFQGVNNSAILLQPPIDFACVGQVYTYNPNAYDVDGDSLAYELVTPLAETGIEVPNYQLPDQIRPGSDNQIDLDNETGEFTWEAPQAQGEYNITYRINEFRNGVLINSILRDMQILVRACPDQNNAPMLDVEDVICVVAGTQIDLGIIATDIDSNEILSITASGGPFELSNNSAELQVEGSLPVSELHGMIRWMTSCEHVSKEFYQIVVRVTDDLSNGMTGLATLHTVRIKVVAPPPQITDAVNENNVVTIQWANPYECGFSSQFQGFSVWRRENSSNINVDTCNASLENLGFEKIVFLTDDIINGNYVVRDSEIEPGKIYCYRVLAEFAQTTDADNLYNRVASLPSEEICIRSSGQEPLITNVTIEETDNSNGSLFVKWVNPDSSGIDTIILTGPYELAVESAANLNGVDLSELASFEYASGDFGTIGDTSLFVSMIDTRSTGHSFNVLFRSGQGNNVFESNTSIASSVYVQSEGRDRAIALTWEDNVPWNNFLYRIYKIENFGISLVDSTSSKNIVVEGLVNGEESCFRIESLGKYGIAEIKEPLVNWSNSTCSVPIDDDPPCTPGFTIASVCENATFSINDDLVNMVNISFEESVCNRAPDLSNIRIYFASNEEEEMVLLEELDSDESSFNHLISENISGCYAITTIDFSGNESALSNIICVDNCPSYILPNTFTPNNDNFNDRFVPRENRFIERVDFEVFNRWGQKVFQTDNPRIEWDGTNFSNKELSEGTYFYSCRVFERRVSGTEEAEILKGTIQLIR